MRDRLLGGRHVVGPTRGDGPMRDSNGALNYGSPRTLLRWPVPWPGKATRICVD